MKTLFLLGLVLWGCPGDDCSLAGMEGGNQRWGGARLDAWGHDHPSGERVVHLLAIIVVTFTEYRDGRKQELLEWAEGSGPQRPEAVKVKFLSVQTLHTKERGASFP